MSYSKIDFLSPCPGRGCNSPEPDRVITWSHSPCSGSREWLDNQANIICKDCGHTFFILDGRFACTYHANEYKAAGYTELANAIAVLITNPEVDESDLAFLMKVSQKVKSRAKERGII